MTGRQPLDFVQKWRVQTYWTAQLPHLTRSALAVLHFLLHRQNTKTGQCNPSANTLAKDTALCVRSVRSAIAELERRGAIVKLSYGKRSSTKYLIRSLDELAQLDTKAEHAQADETDRGVQEGAATRAADCRQRVQRIAPKYIKENIKKKTAGSEATEPQGDVPGSARKEIRCHIPHDCRPVS